MYWARKADRPRGELGRVGEVAGVRGGVVGVRSVMGVRRGDGWGICVREGRESDWLVGRVRGVTVMMPLLRLGLVLGKQLCNRDSLCSLWAPDMRLWYKRTLSCNEAAAQHLHACHTAATRQPQAALAPTMLARL